MSLPPRSAQDADRRPPGNAFTRIRNDFYATWFRFHPEAALDVGVRGYEHLLRPYADQDLIGLLALSEQLIGALEELDESTLDVDDRVDAELMRGAAFLEMEEIREFDWRKRDPEVYLPLHAVFQLLIKDCDDFAGALRGRLSGMPAYLRGAEEHISQQPERIPPRWLESAVTGAESGAAFLRGLPDHEKVRAQAPRLDDLGALAESAAVAVEDYARFLEAEIGGRAAGEFAVGGKRYTHLLNHRHFLTVDPERLHAFGRRLFEDTRVQIRELCRRITGGEDIAGLSARIGADHPPAGRLIEDYSGQMQAAREFSLSRGLLEWPASERLSVSETPGFLRHKIPFAAYEPASPDDAGQHGHYFVTPPAGVDDLHHHNRLAVKHTCVHEAYPGHHVQFATANLHSRSSTLPRLLNKSATLYEGWALYCEQLMFEQGFLDDPLNEFVLLKDRLWRALRIVLDTGMHTGGMSMQDAERLMTEHLGFSDNQALGEATWYSRAPGVPMGYATGWAMVNAARRLTGSDASREKLKAFHDELLGHGSMALALVLERGFGEELARQVLAEIAA